MSERIINAERIEQIINVFGSFDENIKRIEQTYGVKITNRGTELKISGEDEAADRAGRAIEGLLLLAAGGVHSGFRLIQLHQVLPDGLVLGVVPLVLVLAPLLSLAV